MSDIKVSLKRLPSTHVNKSRGYGKIELSQYAVIRDGQEVGRVFQHRAETMNRYAGFATYGYPTSRTCWAWEADMMGDYELATRKEALDDMLSNINDEVHK